VFFPDSYQNFSFKQTDYPITNTKIPESQIKGVLSKFYKMVIVKENIPKGSSNSIAFNNLYQTSDNALCIGVNDSNYQVLSGRQLPAGKRLNFQDFAEAKGDFSVDKNDVRKIDYGNSIFRVTDKAVAESEKGDYLDTLAQVKVFETLTGTEIPPLEWGKIDLDGSSSKIPCSEWNYGDIYSLKNSAVNQGFVVEINNEFRLATPE
jgi:hypothetical protein